VGREPTREEVEAWAKYLLAHPDVLEHPQVGRIAEMVTFRARVNARRQRNAQHVARSTLRLIFGSPSAEITREQIVAARRLHLAGDPRSEWAILATSRSTLVRRRRRYGLVPWPPEIVPKIDTDTPVRDTPRALASPASGPTMTPRHG
jgi:hypothetical protein